MHFVFIKFLVSGKSGLILAIMEGNYLTIGNERVQKWKRRKGWGGWKTEVIKRKNVGGNEMKNV